MKTPSTWEERVLRSAPWTAPAFQWPAENTLQSDNPRLRIEAMIRFGHRWQEFWIGRDWYIGSGLPFAVADALAAIDGRDAWDWDHEQDPRWGRK